LSLMWTVFAYHSKRTTGSPSRQMDIPRFYCSIRYEYMFYAPDSKARSVATQASPRHWCLTTQKLTLNPIPIRPATTRSKYMPGSLTENQTKQPGEEPASSHPATRNSSTPPRCINHVKSHGHHHSCRRNKSMQMYSAASSNGKTTIHTATINNPSGPAPSPEDGLSNVWYS